VFLFVAHFKEGVHQIDVALFFARDFLLEFEVLPKNVFHTLQSLGDLIFDIGGWNSTLCRQGRTGHHHYQLLQLVDLLVFRLQLKPKAARCLLELADLHFLGLNQTVQLLDLGPYTSASSTYFGFYPFKI